VLCLISEEIIPTGYYTKNIKGVQVRTGLHIHIHTRKKIFEVTKLAWNEHAFFSLFWRFLENIYVVKYCMKPTCLVHPNV